MSISFRKTALGCVGREYWTMSMKKKTTRGEWQEQLKRNARNAEAQKVIIKKPRLGPDKTVCLKINNCNY